MISCATEVISGVTDLYCDMRNNINLLNGNYYKLSLTSLRGDGLNEGVVWPR